MTEQPTVQSVMERAIAKEIEAQQLYRDLAGLAEESAAKEMFETLIGVEKKHEELLTRYLEGTLGEGGLKADHALDYHIAEYFEAPEITPGMKLDEVLLLASQREKVSHDLYLGLAAAHPEGKIRQLFEDLAAQELDHKHRMEDYYTDVAFPQTEGG